MQLIQSRDLLSFITSMKVDAVGVIKTNQLDEELPQVSQFYTPNYDMSSLSIHVRNIIKQGTTFQPNSRLSAPVAVDMINNSDLKVTMPRVYVLLQAIFLEGFSLLYVTDIDGSLTSLISKEDMERVYQNINYVIECIGIKRDLRSTVVPILREIASDILYVQSRLRGETNAL